MDIRFTRPIPVIMIVWFAFAPASLSAQASDPKPFSISLTDDGTLVEIKCQSGCAWSELTFNEKNRGQAVDEYGMTSVKNPSTLVSEGLGDFLFTIQRRKGNLILKSLGGTAWTQLTFPCATVPCSASFDAQGKK